MNIKLYNYDIVFISCRMFRVSLCMLALVAHMALASRPYDCDRKPENRHIQEREEDNSDHFMLSIVEHNSHSAGGEVEGMSDG